MASSTADGNAFQYAIGSRGVPVTTIDKKAEALEKGHVSGGELLPIDRGPVPPLTPPTYQ